MPQSAVAVALTSEVRPAVPAGRSESLAALGRQVGYGRRLRPRRSHLGALIIVVIAIWLVLVFGRTLSQQNAANERQAAAHAEIAALQLRLEEGQRELELVQTDDFLRLQARGYGMGRADERVFSLLPGAPPPPAITPLGGVDPATIEQTPLESWLGLLFGD